MSTQHPDNVRQPFFVNNSVIAGDEEIKEAFYAFSHLKIKEQLWDCEGKEVDNFVVEKLLTRYEDYFSHNKLGKDIFITLRGPNPRIEKQQGKILIEALESIPRNFDIAKHFYKEDIAPIFEIAIPMTSSAAEILRVKDYYNKFIVGKQDKLTNDIKIKDWVGEFKPDELKVIPLIEDKESMLNADKIVKEYLQKTKEDYMRVWLARSDPALNYGNVSAILINKVSLQRLHKLEENISVDLYPIIGCGSVPFRGGFRPDKFENCMNAYPSVQTFTLQSAYKYDFPEDVVRKSVEHIENTKRKKPVQVDEKRAIEIIDKVSDEYQKQVKPIAPLINNFAHYIPQRRKRKLHIGLFGYSRKSAKVTLPRAIKFCASLYSLGIPPELLGLSALNDKDYEFIEDVTSSFRTDMKDALQYVNRDNLRILPEKMQKDINKVLENFDFEIDRKHEKITNFILEGFKKNQTEALVENIERAASLRNFLG